MRNKWVIGNWKMHGSSSFAEQWITEFNDNVPEGINAAVCPPFPYVPQLAQQTQGQTLQVGAQDVAATEEGAFTGEVAASMLADVNATLALVGHSERRALFHETDANVVEKCRQLVAHNITPVVCLGETQAQREAGETEKVVAAQLAPLLAAMKETPMQVVLAYEPVWAIGTGLTATPEQAQAVHAFIRTELAKTNAELAQSTPILYGGSVNRDNAASLFAEEDIDGGLIGGASLQAEHFSAICEALKGRKA